MAGNKAAKVNKLCQIYGSDEVDPEELEEETQDDSTQQQMNELRQALMELTKTVGELSAVRNAGGQVNEESTHDSQRVTTQPLENGVTATPRQATAALQRPASVHEISGLLPTFDPLKGSIGSEVFVEKVEQLQNVYGWSDKEILVAAQLNLKGVAKTWLDSQQVFKTWAEFVQILKNDFPKKVMSAQLHREMAQRKRQPRETFEEFYYAMLSMGRRGKMDEESINSYIIAGLNDANLSRTLLAMKLPTCNDLLRSLEAMAIMSTQSTTRSSVSIDKDSTESTQKVATDKKQIKCYNCNELGHISSKCTQPQRKPRCTKCNKAGHEAKTCKAEKSTVAEVQSAAKGAPNPVIKVAEWNGKRYDAFIDTGSDVSLIAASKVPSDTQRTLSTKRLTGFGGAVISSTEAINAKINIDGLTILATCQIVPDKYMSFDFLIGRDVLCQNDCRLTIDAGVMQVQRKTENLFNVNNDLPNDVITKVNELLYKYDDCFAEDLAKLGRCKSMEMDIVISTDQPVVGKRYQVPLSQRPTLSKIIDNLLKHGIIRYSSSPHAAPVIIVQKSNGEDRMCVDYRALNSVTIKKHFPMPVVEEQLSKLVGNTFFTSLDMTSGYYQIPLKEESKQFTAFLTPDGLFEHNVMPFGLRNAPMVFQEMIVRLIRSLKHRNRIISYVDEVVIATKSIDESIEVLTELLEAVRVAGLTLRPSKCSFLATTIQFLGHVVDAKGIRPGEGKVKCIIEFPQPRTPTEVRQFLGLTGFFRKFVEGYGIIAKPLASLLRKGIKFEWTREHEESFRKLKEALTTQPVLVMFDMTKNHEVHTDASAIGLAGVMLQQEGNDWKPVQYYSRQCSSVETQYPSHELEVLAIVESLERFRVFLLGTHFVVRTDCNAVATTKSITPLRPRVARWWLRLQEFDFDCVHRAGSKMQHVDSLSRAPTEPPSQPDTVAERILQVSQVMKPDDWVYAMQTQDAKLRQICEVLQGNGKVDEPIAKQIREDYAIRNDRLFRKVGQEYKLVVPRAVRWRVTKASHDDAGHFALEKTLSRISKHFWFERMRRYVKSYISSCEECCFNKVKGGRKESQLHVMDVLPIPFRHIYIDHVGPFPKSKSGFVYVLVIVCGFSKYAVFKPVRNTKTEPVIKALDEMMTIFGQPLKITSDRGTAFTSTKFQAFIEKRGIQHIKTAVRTPRANGQAERCNKTLIQALKCAVNESKNWDASLTTIQWSLNSQKNEVTGYTPNELVFYYNPRDVTYNRLVQAIHDEVDMSDIEVKRSEAANKIMAERKKWKERYDKKHQSPTNYEVGDLVVVDHVPTSTGESHKLDPAYKGPYIITKVLDYDRYIVEDLPDVTVTQRRYSNVMSADHLKPWCISKPELEMDEESDESSYEDEKSGKAELSQTVSSSVDI